MTTCSVRARTSFSSCECVPQGPRGPRGRQGDPGTVGRAGATGPTGPAGSDFQQQTLEIQGVISPDRLPLGVTNDWNPTGLATASIVLAQASDATTALSGLVAQPNGRVVLITNRDGLGSITFLEEDGGSAPENRFRFSVSGTDTWRLDAFQTVVLFYDTTLQRWRVWGIFTETFPALAVKGITNIQGVFLTSGALTPPPIAGTVNDYFPGFVNPLYSVLRQDLSGPATITGLADTGPGRRIVIRNISLTQTLTLTNEDLGSVPNARFSLPGAVSLLIIPQGSVEVIYDIPNSRWFVV